MQQIFLDSDKENIEPTSTLSATPNEKIRERIKEGDCIYKEGRYSKAYEIYKNIFETIKSSYPETSPEIIDLHHKIGLSSLKMSRHTEAHSFLIKALELKRNMNDGDCLLLARVTKNLGEVYVGQVKHADALEAFQTALKILLDAFGEEHPEVANCYNSIAELYIQQGKFNESIEYLNKSIKIASASSTANADLATSYFLIGCAYRSLANYPSALSYTKKALNMSQQIHGPRHPEVALCYNATGNSFLNQANYTEALENYNKSLEMRLEFLGQSHPGVATSYHNIGIAYSYMGNYKKAFENYNNSLKIRIEFFGEKHPSVADSYSNIASFYCETKDYVKALQYYQQALDIQIHFYGENHPDVALSYNNIGNIYQRQGNHAKAQENVAKSLTIKTKYFGRNHPQVANSYHILGSLFYDQKNYLKAMTNFIYSLKIRRLFYPDNHHLIANCYYALGLFAEANKDLELAEKYSMKAHMAYKEVHEVNHNISAMRRRNFEELRCKLDHNNSYI